MSEKKDTRTWPELAAGLYDNLTGRGAEITYAFDHMEVWVPSSASDNAAHAHWKVNGQIRVSTKDAVNTVPS